MEANTVGVKATLNLYAKLDQGSLKDVQEQLKKGIGSVSTGSGGGGSSKGSSGGGVATVEQLTGGSLFGGGGGGGAGGMGKAGAAGAAATGGIMILEKIFQVLEQFFKLAMESSPLFKSVAKLFQTSMNLLFMPIGNMMAKILMPIMISYMQKAAARAQKYANAPPEQLGEVTAGAIEDMMGALTEVFGTIFTQILPSVASGMLEGLASTIGAWLSGKNPSSSDLDVSQTQAVKKAQEFYKSSLVDAGKNMYSSVEGYTTTLDQFGLTTYTANNEIGDAVSEMAVTFYSGATSIEGGFNYTHEVMTIGTDKAIEKVNEWFKEADSSVYTNISTIDGSVKTGGQTIDLAFNKAGATIQEKVDLFDQPIWDSIQDMEDLGGGFNALNTTVWNVVESLLEAQRQIDLDNTINTTPKTWANTGMTSVDLAHKFSKTQTQYRVLSKSNAADMELLKKLQVNYQDGMTLATFDTGYEILDANGKPINYGLYGRAGAEAAGLNVANATKGEVLGETNATFRLASSYDEWTGNARYDNGIAVQSYMGSNPASSGGSTNTTQSGRGGGYINLASNAGSFIGSSNNGQVDSQIAAIKPSTTKNTNVTLNVQGNVYNNSELKSYIRQCIQEELNNNKGSY